MLDLCPYDKWEVHVMKGTHRILRDIFGRNVNYQTNFKIMHLKGPFCVSHNHYKSDKRLSPIIPTTILKVTHVHET